MIICCWFVVYFDDGGDYGVDVLVLAAAVVVVGVIVVVVNAYVVYPLRLMYQKRVLHGRFFILYFLLCAQESQGNVRIHGVPQDVLMQPI